MKHWQHSCLTCTLSFCLHGLATAQEWEVPRTEFGQPDMQGFWTNSTQTPLARDERYGDKGFLTAEEAEQQRQRWVSVYATQGAAVDPERGAPTDGRVAAYNNFWSDPRADVVEINGEYRTSIITDPRDGNIPYLEPDEIDRILKERIAANPDGYVRITPIDNSVRAQWLAGPDVGPADGPEVRTFAERCLLSFLTLADGVPPPLLPTRYNSNYQIIQTDDYFVIQLEMVHDARIIPLNKDNQGTGVIKWLGDSVGYWEGDTLIVKTRNFHPQHSFQGSFGGTMTLVEEFELIEPGKIRYGFTVEDPSTYSQPWSGEVAMRRLEEGEVIHEYACHEGNYGLPAILRGARFEEKTEEKL